jgi:hypothetical protein
MMEQHIIEQLDIEPDIIFNFRKTFYDKYKKNNPNESDKNIIIYSKIAANIKFKQCRYDSKLYHKVNAYL